MTAPRARFLTLALVAHSGCQRDPGYPIQVDVTTSDGQPVAAVAVRFDDGRLATTDELGQVRRRIAGPAGARVAIEIEPTPGHRVVGPASRSVVLRHPAEVEGATSDAPPIELRFELAPASREYAILVRAGVPGLPVSALGEERARTNREGVAMFLHRGQPGEPLTVTLDTSDLPSLRPRSPATTFRLGLEPEAYVVRARFSETAAAARRRPPARRRP